MLPAFATPAAPAPTMPPSIISLPILRDMPAEVRAGIAEHAVLRTHPHKAVLFRQQDHASAVFGIVTGAVRLETPAISGAVAISALVPPHVWLGEVSMCDGRPHGVSAICNGPTTVLELPARGFEQLMSTVPEMARVVLGWVCLKERVNRQYAAEASTLPLEQRLARRVLPLLRVWGVPLESGAMQIDIDITQDDLGHMLGASRQRINQIIGDWEQRGWLSNRYRRLVVHDRAALEAVAGPIAPVFDELVARAEGRLP